MVVVVPWSVHAHAHARTDSGKLNDFSFMHDGARHRVGNTTLTDPNLALAQGKFGLCAVLHDQLLSSGMSTRACKYYALLRHPVARIKSAYDYFCR